MGRKRTWLMTVSVLCLLQAPGIAHAGPRTARQQVDEILRLVESSYVGDLAADSLASAIRTSIFKMLDPYSQYLDRSAYADFKRDLAGSFSGIGALFRFDDDLSMIRVEAPFRNSPADRAGIRSGDLLIAIDGQAMAGRSVDDARALLIGEKGTSVSVTLRRGGPGRDTTYSLERAQIVTPSVRGYRAPVAGTGEYLVDEAGRIGYVRIQYFDRRTEEEFVEAVAALHETGARAFVLDLRLTPGGLMKSAIAVADQLLEEGTIVTTRSRKKEETIRAGRGVCTSLPIALLIDEGTASSAEICAAALADNRRVTVIGSSHSYGKGHGQELFALNDGREGMKLTTFSYHRPSGLPLERHFGDADSSRAGVWPDPGMTVPLTEADRKAWEEAVFEMDARMLYTDDYVATLPPIAVRDPVLERAIAFLRDGR